MTKRIASLWFEHLPMEHHMRHHLIDGPFALYRHQKNADRIYALNHAAKRAGLSIGMGLGDARGLCTRLQTAPANPQKDQRFLMSLARFAQAYCPWVGLDGDDGLVLNLSGSAHLWGGEANFAKRAKTDFARLGLSVKIGIAPTRGAAWALSHFDEGITNDPRAALHNLPIAALRISEADEVLARRLGLHKIGDLIGKPRAEMARRFGMETLLRLDQALGEQFENLSPIGEPRIFAARMNLPEPIGLLSDVMAGMERLLEALALKLSQHAQAMQELHIRLRMVDGKWHDERIRFARPMQRKEDLLPLIEPKLAPLDAGFGFDLLRAEAKSLSDWSTGYVMGINSERGFHDLLSKIGNRIGFQNIQRLAPCDRHLPEEASVFQPFDQAIQPMTPTTKPRPLLILPPERLSTKSTSFPPKFTWRRMTFRTARAIGPERIAPEWWQDNDAWKSGVRDYWRVATHDGRRLWMFFTPKNPAWYVHGEFA